MPVTFTERELDVMTVLWDAGPSTAAEVRSHLGIDLAYNTVLSVLRTLEEKGHVGHAVEGKAHRFRALVRRAEAGRSAVGRLLDTVFGGSAELMLTQLVGDQRVDAQQLKALRKLLDDRIAKESRLRRGGEG